MVDFAVYGEARFVGILEGVYHLEQVGREGAGLPCLLFRSRHGKKDVLNTPFNYYRNPPEALDEGFWQELNEFSKQTGVNVRFKTLLDVPYGSRVETARNPILRLRGDYEEQVTGFSANLKKNLKRNRNKAKRLGVSFEVADSLQEWRDFYVQVFARQYIRKHKMVFQPFVLFEKLRENGFAKLWVAKAEGNIIGGIVCIEDGEVLHYNWGASQPYQNIAVGMLLVDTALRSAIDQQYRWFDLGSTASSDQELLEFKLRFGAEDCPAYEYYTMQPPEIVDLHGSYGLAREVYARFPEGFLRWLMPHLVPRLVR